MQEPVPDAAPTFGGVHVLSAELASLLQESNIGDEPAPGNGVISPPDSFGPCPWHGTWDP